jgi:hypothetical protein
LGVEDMNIFLEFSKAFRETKNLERRYYILTSVVGLAGVLVGIAFMAVTATFFAEFLGIELTKPLREEPNGRLWFGAFLTSIPIAIYLGVICVAGLFSAVMVGVGKVTMNDAVRYTFLSRYPRTWFRKK